ncbi:MAG: helix-turn-helix transcriptional regulator [Clostridia bacterium]|nr:helix-turn-helix transcriptional regulator [Clostridia bacterium]
MERKSIGSFIAVLRKASGLTQRELADKLGVSDKAVSRWERDETAPDLYLIPVIAEIFGVTSDELLRGERVGESAPPPEKRAEKTERQIKTVLKAVRTRFLTKTLICTLIATVGLLAAVLCNFAFYKGKLGFYIGLIFFVTAVVTEVVFAVLAFSGLDAEEFEGAHLAETRKYIIKKTETLIFLVFIILAYTLPLPITAEQTSFADVGMDFEEWLAFGVLSAAIAGIICAIANIIADKIFEKKGIYTVDEKISRLRHLAKIRFASPLPKLAKVFLPLTAVTVALHIIALSTFDYEFFLHGKGTEWTDANAFVAYMETPLDENGNLYVAAYTSFPVHTVFVYTEKGAVKIRFEKQNLYVDAYHIKKQSNEIIYSDSEHAPIVSVTPDEVIVEGEKPVIPEDENEIYDIPDFYAKTYTCKETAEAYGWAYGINTGFVLAYIAEGLSLFIAYTVKVLKKFQETRA